jgi:hypothetical protein
MSTVLAALLLPGTVPASAADFGLSGGYVLRERSDWNVADPSLLFAPPKVKKFLGEDSFDPVDTHRLLAWAFARGVMTLGDRFSAVASLDTTALSLDLTGGGPFSATSSDSILLADGGTVEEAAGNAAFVRELYFDLVALPSDALLVSAGKRRSTILGGLLYDDYGVSAEIQWDIVADGRWSLTATTLALLPQTALGRLDPALSLGGGRIGWSFRGTVLLEVGALWLRDRSGLVPGMMRDMLATELMASGRWGAGAAVLEKPIAGEADIATVHASAEVDFGVAGARILAAFQAGTVDLENLSNGKVTSGRPAGNALLVETPFTPVPELRITPFLLRVSGSAKGQWTDDRQLGSFVTLAPLFGRAAMFLGGDIDPALTRRDFRCLGLGARGVSAAGLDARWEPLDRLRLGHSTTVLGHARSGDGVASAEYGVELDTWAVVGVLSWLDVRAEVDMLVPGEYFGDSESMVRLSAGVEGTF